MNDTRSSMSNNLPVEDGRVGELAVKIQGLVQSVKVKVAREINSAMVNTYWEIGRYIVEFEQNGNPTANYGSSLLTELAKQLTARLGSGYSRPNLNRMRQFYLTYPICSTLSNKLSWSHICELLMIEDDCYEMGGSHNLTIVFAASSRLPNKKISTNSDLSG